MSEELTPQEDSCPCGSWASFNECCGTGICCDELEDAVVFVLKRHTATQHLSEHEMWRLAEQVTDIAWPLEHPPMHEDPAGCSPQEVRCIDPVHPGFPDAVRLVGDGDGDDELDFVALIG